jgi:hypothetical protein
MPMAWPQMSRMPQMEKPQMTQWTQTGRTRPVEEYP